MRIIESNKTYRHYGSDKYNNDIKVDLSRRSWINKPEKAAIWGSPIESNFGWKKWCEREDFALDSLKTYFDFKLRPGSKVLTIENEHDLDGFDEFIQYYDSRKMPICELIEYLKNYGPRLMSDWEKLVNIVDAVEIVDNNFTRHRFYGWDCDSICVLNPDAVEEVV